MPEGKGFVKNIQTEREGSPKMLPQRVCRLRARWGKGFRKTAIWNDRCLKKMCFRGSAACASEGKGFVKKYTSEREGFENLLHHRVKNLLARKEWIC